VWRTLKLHVIFRSVICRSLKDVAWAKLGNGAQVDFELIPKDPIAGEAAQRMRRQGKPQHRVSVFPLNAESKSHVGDFWVSWHEAWKKRESQRFSLLNAGWTLFEGPRGNEDKTQVLRVDWDQPPHTGDVHAGHPHWHFDHEVFLSLVEEEVEIAPGLVEVTGAGGPSAGRQESVSHIHLAMGAWNSGADHPECWQRTYDEDCGQLYDWCTKTLEYLKDQVGGSS